jgi:2-dehydro-3-deoxygluconokinase
MPEIVTLGEAMLVFVPAEIGALREAMHFQRFLAGAEANTAVALARLGHSVGFIGQVGDDEFGAAVVDLLTAEGVDTTRLRRIPGGFTGIYFKERSGSHNTPRVFYYRAGSAASGIGPDDLDPAAFAGTRLVHLTGITPALSDSCAEAVRRAISRARTAGARISFDPNHRAKLWPRDTAAPVLRELMAQADIALPNEDEAQMLVGDGGVEALARRIHDLGPQVVVIKLGEAGAVGFWGEALVRVHAEAVEVVDPVGAGDAFNAGFLSGVLRGWSLRRCLEFGMRLGAAATTGVGDMDGLSEAGKMQKWLEGHGR